MAYTGISQKAIEGTLQSDLDNASRKLKLYQIDNASFPSSLSNDGNGNYCPSPPDLRYCIKPSQGNEFLNYTSLSSNVFTLDVRHTADGITYHITNDTAPVKVITGGSTVITSIASIGGTAQIGQTLSAGTIAPSAANASYQWQISDTVGGTYTDIDGATSNSYIPKITGWDEEYLNYLTDLGKFIRVVVTGIGGYTGTATSTPTAAVLDEAPGIISVGNVIATGNVNPVITVRTTKWTYYWKVGLTPSDFTFSFGTTGLTLASVTRINYNDLEVAFNGTAAAGNITIQGKTSAFDPTGPTASNNLTVVSGGSPWIAGISGSALDGKYVYKQTLSSKLAWKTTQTTCVSPQCATGSDPDHPTSPVLVSPQTYPAVDFSAYPAQNACKALGGRLPNVHELMAMPTNLGSYGNNFNEQMASYWSATELEGVSYASYIGDLWYNYTMNSGMDMSGDYGFAIRCVK